jgi:hypothetical protein
MKDYTIVIYKIGTLLVAYEGEEKEVTQRLRHACPSTTLNTLCCIDLETGECDNHELFQHVITLTDSKDIEDFEEWDSCCNCYGKSTPEEMIGHFRNWQKKYKGEIIEKDPTSKS